MRSQPWTGKLSRFPKTIRFGQTMLIACAALAFCHTSHPANADEVELRRLLHGPDRCDHVIGLLMRYGVNQNAMATPALGAIHPLGPVEIPADDLGDLELVSIARHAEMSDGCGPSFELVIKNCSTRDVCGSRVTLVGLFGRIRPTSPNVTAKIESIPAGQVIAVTVTLPIESLAMGHFNGQAIAMNRVLVAVDSFDQFLESDESNNLRVFDASAIPLATTANTESVMVQPTSPTAASPQPQGSEPQPAPATADPAMQSTPSPSASQNELPRSDLRSAIDQFSNQAASE